jgi:head-tail adaptor
MSFGKMNTMIDIISVTPVKDADGFSTGDETILATVPAYKEDRHGTEKWANMAVFSEASTMFRFRFIPNVEVDASMVVSCGGKRYRLLSVENVRGRNMYIEALAQCIEPSMR